MSIQTMLLIMDIIAFVIYGLLKIKMKSKPFRGISLVALLVYFSAILFITVFSRQPVLEVRWNVIPLQSWGPDDFYIQILPNILIFMPVGFLLVGLLPDCKLIYTILIGTGVSLCIEIVQLLVHVGICDIDDLIANSLGCMFGVLPAHLLDLWLHRKNSSLEK